MLKLNYDAEVEYIESITLKSMQEAVGGNVQFLTSKDGMVVFADDEGMLKGRDPSAFIPDFLRYMGFSGRLPVVIYGDVVITTDDKELTNKQIKFIKDSRVAWYAEIYGDKEEDEEEDEPAPKKSK